MPRLEDECEAQSRGSVRQTRSEPPDEMSPAEMRPRDRLRVECPDSDPSGQFMVQLLGVIVGLLSGTHTATWGMYKDAPHEGFRRYHRSIITAAVIGPLIVTIVPRPWVSAGGLALLFGLTYICERGA